jgi:uncharacterized protein YgbK (DUF1537 family)
MRDHPLTPMRDPSLVRVCSAEPPQVGWCRWRPSRGAEAIRAAFAELKRDGYRHTIVDAIEDRHLEAIRAAADFRRSPAALG